MNRLIFMALGKRKPQQDELFIPTAKLAPGPGHPFYSKVNEVLNGHNFGVLWKPPFRVSITTAAKPGVNKLTVRVTNLWPRQGYPQLKYYRAAHLLSCSSMWFLIL